MLFELIALLKERKRATLRELSVLAHQKEEVTEQIMEQLIRKGLASKQTISCKGCLKDCSSCLSRGDLIYYEPVES